MAIRVYIKTYNYHELNTNYHKLILFRYLQIRFMLLFISRAPARQKIFPQILNKIYVPLYPPAPARQKILSQILNKIYVPFIPPLFEFTCIPLTSYLSPLPSKEYFK